jgi:protein-S-isoprenylcysteine O-methyltransferase Ste14
VIDERPTTPGVHCPPPFVFVSAFLIGMGLDRWGVELRFGPGGRPALLLAGWLPGALGLGVMLWAMLTFRRARTSLLPFRPATAMVTSGPYRFSRNPMYLGLTLLYVGLSFLTRMAWPLVMLPFALWALTALVIRREEWYLAAEFGPAYADYRKRVRRWI